jgi:hypothetical protein
MDEIYLPGEAGEALPSPPLFAGEDGIPMVDTVFILLASTATKDSISQS